jgi:hypothetical protein
MEYNNYQIDKKYNIRSLIHFWKTKEKTDEITIVKNDYIIFKKTTIDPFLLSKINFCIRAYIKMKIISKILYKIKFNNQFLPQELNKLIISFLGYKDRLYYNNSEYFKELNRLGYYKPYKDLIKD